MIHSISIKNETLSAFKHALEANNTDFVILSEDEDRTTFQLDLKFTNELFYLGASYGINALSKSLTPAP